MRINDPIAGIIIQYQAISHEAERAQRMAELKNIAEYRARHLKAIQDWSDPVKRKKIQDEHAAAEKIARDQMAGELIDDFRVRKVEQGRFVNSGAMDSPRSTGSVNPMPRVSDFKIKPIVKARPIRRWWRRILDWLR